MKINILLITLGAAYWLLTKYKQAVCLRNFRRETFIKKNFPAFALNIVAGIALVLSLPPDGAFQIQVAGVNIAAFLWFFVGMGGQQISRKLFKSFINKL